MQLTRVETSYAAWPPVGWVRDGAPASLFNDFSLNPLHITYVLLTGAEFALKLYC